MQYFVQCFQSSGNNQVRICIWAMEYELHNIRDSTYELNALTFAFETHNNIKLNIKIHANM